MKYISFAGFEVEIVPRENWGACKPVKVEPITTPVKHIFICHTVSSQCHTVRECAKLMKEMQKFHMSKGLF